jgi:hypothetical protein
MQRNRCRGIHERRDGITALVIGFLVAALLPLMAATPGSAETLDRIRQSGTITLATEPMRGLSRTRMRRARQPATRWISVNESPKK